MNNKLKQLIRESINEYIRNIEESGNMAATKAKITACQEAIELREKKLNMEGIDEAYHDMLDKGKMKELGNEIKALKKSLAKYEKQLEKLKNKGKKSEEPKEETEKEIVDEVNIDENFPEAGPELEETELNESFLHMQKLAGLITEAEYYQKKSLIENEDDNKPFSFDYNPDWKKIKILGTKGELIMFADPEDPYLDEEEYSFAIEKKQISQVANGEKIGVEDESDISYNMTSKDAKNILNNIKVLKENQDDSFTPEELDSIAEEVKDFLEEKSPESNVSDELPGYKYGAYAGYEAWSMLWEKAFRGIYNRPFDYKETSDDYNKVEELVKKLDDAKLIHLEW